MYKAEWQGKDFYADLGLTKDATDDQIKKAYRKMAIKYHPDRNPGDKVAEEKFKAINEANDVLSNPEERKDYDAGPGMGGGMFGGFGGANTADIDDLLKNMQANGGSFGDDFSFLGRRRGRGHTTGFTAPDPGRRSTYADGGFNDLLNNLLNKDEDKRPKTGFQGSKSPKGSNASTVSTGGTESEVKLSFTDAYKGAEVSVQNGDESFRMRIPAGIKNGQKIKAPSRPGLTIRVKVADDPNYTWDGKDIIVYHPISPAVAVNGGTETITLPDGSKVRVNLPKRSDKERLAIAGKGVKGHDVIVKSYIKLPDTLTDAQERALSTF